MTIKNFFFSCVVLASAAGFSMQEGNIEDYVQRFKRTGDIFECSPEFRGNKDLMNALYPALAQAISREDSTFHTKRVAFKFVEAKNVNPVIKSFVHNSQITSVSFQYCQLDAAIIESLKAMLTENKTLKDITFTSPYLDADLVEGLEAIANEDKRVMVIAPNPAQFDSKY